MMRLLIVSLSVLTLFFTPLTILAEEKSSTHQTEPVVVTATRIDTPMDQIGKSVSVITQQDIQNNVNTTLGNLLLPVPSVRVRQNGGPGTFSPVQIRGSTPGQVRLLIDGFPVLDPSNFGGDPSDLFQNLFMDDVQRIEVVRGPLSTLYGADALGGTINLITKKGEGKPEAQGFFEGGTKSTFHEGASFRGAEKKFNYSFQVIRNDSNGLSDNDIFNATTLSTRLGAEITEALNVSSYFRYTKSRVGFDELGGPPDFKQVKDPFRIQRSDAIFWGTELTHKICDVWDQKLRYSYNHADTGLHEKISSPALVVRGLLNKLSTRGILNTVELLENFYGLKNHILTMGLVYERQDAEVNTKVFGVPRGKVDRGVDNKAIFFQDQLALWEKFFLTSSLRVDHYASFGTTVNYAFSLAYLIKEFGTKLKGNVGTAFNDPSLTELFDPVLGNSTLEPEEVIGFDFGFDQKVFTDKVSVGATYFRQDYTNLITISRIVTPAGIRRQAINSGDAFAQGMELQGKVDLIENLSVGVNYTLTDSKLKKFGSRIPEIPNNTVSVFADYRLWKKIRLHADVNFVDDSVIAPVPGFPKNEAHTTVDLNLFYDVCPNCTVFGRVQNLFDENYKDDTIEAPGIFAFGGVTVKI